MTKYDAEQRIGYGVLAEERVDKAEEIFDYESSKPLFEAWSESFKKATEGKSAGNLREMHGNVAAGKFIEVGYDDAAKNIPVAFKVVDDAAHKKCTEGVYTGLSIGGKYLKRWADPDKPGVTRYTADPHEGSLVDNPCMYGATFQLVRAAGAEPELCKFTGEPTPEPAPVQDPPAPPAPAEPVEKDAAAVVTQAQQVLDGLKALLQQYAMLEGDPATWTMESIAQAMSAVLGVKYDAQYQQVQDGLAAVGEKLAPLADLSKTLSAVEAMPPAIEKASTDVVAKVQEALAAGVLLSKAAQDELAKAVGETVTQLVKAATDELQKAVADLAERFTTIEKRPAEVGHPVRRVERTLGGGSDPAKAQAVGDIEKFLADATKSGKVSGAALQEMRIYAASLLM